jgi:hypothetical protein
VPIFVDILLAIVYLAIVFGPLLALVLLVVMIVYVWASVYLTQHRVTLRRMMNDKDRYVRGIHSDALMSWETWVLFQALSASMPVSGAQTDIYVSLILGFGQCQVVHGRAIRKQQIPRSSQRLSEVRMVCPVVFADPQSRPELCHLDRTFGRVSDRCS